MRKTKDILQAEVRQAIKDNGGSGICLLATGTGKSKIGVDEICEELDNFDFTGYEPPLICVPTKKLRDRGWEEEFSKWGREEEFKKIERSCYVSINKRVGGRYRIVVLDEGHRITTENYKFFENNQIERIIVLTATEPKDKEKRDLLQSLTQVVYNYPLDQALEDGLVAPFDIYVIWTTLNDIDRYVKCGGKTKVWYSTEKIQYDYLSSSVEKAKVAIKDWKIENDSLTPFISNYQKEKSEKRGESFLKNYSKERQEQIIKGEKKLSSLESFSFMKTLERIRFIGSLHSKEKIVDDLINRLLREERRFLVFCASIAQTEKLCNGYTFHSETTSDAYNAFLNLDIDYLGVVDSVNEGTNFNDIDDGIINKLNKNDLNFIQRLGRIVRLRDGHRARMFIVALKNSPEEEAVIASLKSFNKENIYYYTQMNYHKIFQKEEE